jgi:REP-associated tyrosine transposase
MKIFDRRSIRLKEYDYSQPGAYFVTICTDNRQFIFGNIVEGEMILNRFGLEVEQYCKITENHFNNIKFDIHMTMPNHFHAIIQITSHNPVVVGAGSPCPKMNNTRPKMNNTRPKMIDPYTNLNNKHNNVNIRYPNVNNKIPMVNNECPIINNKCQNTTYPNKNIGKHNKNIGTNNITHYVSHGNRLGIYTNRSGFNTIGRGDLATLGQIVGFFKYGISKHINLIRNTPGTKLWQRNYYEHIIRNENEYDRITEYIKNNPMKWEFDGFNPNV